MTARTQEIEQSTKVEVDFRHHPVVGRSRRLRTSSLFWVLTKVAARFGVIKHEKHALRLHQPTAQPDGPSAPATAPSRGLHPLGPHSKRKSDVEQRHASFLSNAQSLLQGSGIDAPLNDVVGRAQASALARSLASIQMDLIASSTLSRAVETADIVASQLLIVQFSMGNYTLVM